MSIFGRIFSRKVEFIPKEVKQWNQFLPWTLEPVWSWDW